MKRTSTSLTKLGIPLTLSPMEAALVAELPRDAEGWQFEPKWDGFRCLAFRAGSAAEIKAKSGKSLSRFFPEALANLRALSHAAFVLDGELIIGLGGESFDALQMRLHPAQSRIDRLAEETPAKLIVFDCLLTKPGQPLLDRPFAKRREALEALFERIGDAHGLALTPYTREVRKARPWLGPRQGWLDGVVAKRLDLPYRPGQRAMLKIKRRQTLTALSAAFAMRAAPARSARSFLGSMTRPACCITSASRPLLPPVTSLRSQSAWRSSSRDPDSREMRPGVPAAGAPTARRNGSR
jgi:ATP-dependent DNA ligase